MFLTWRLKKSTGKILNIEQGQVHEPPNLGDMICEHWTPNSLFIHRQVLVPKPMWVAPQVLQVLHFNFLLTLGHSGEGKPKLFLLTWFSWNTKYCQEAELGQIEEPTGGGAGDPGSPFLHSNCLLKDCSVHYRYLYWPRRRHCNGRFNTWKETIGTCWPKCWSHWRSPTGHWRGWESQGASGSQGAREGKLDTDKDEILLRIVFRRHQDLPHSRLPWWWIL